MSYEKYGLEKWEDMKLEQVYLDKSIDNIQKIHELFKIKTTDNKKFVRYEDYLGRKISLRWNTYTTKTLGKKYKGQKRELLFPHIDDVLKNPDEVWLRYYGVDKRTGENIYQTDYIKFYDNAKILVNTTTTEDMEGIEINTWFSIDDVNQKERRKGILIRKGKE
ncbi:hypothetical protein EQP59_04480 [Ornithobacterium rhinotracheale]|uniref:Phage-Barnase-EndoU-ColicinE5/D-RelE like nuclease 2 domain-containing protein n=1 Tax=Ornithobacterium rhinotracheale TaxID=28251 RepID=A0A410JR67_ORNRH|nr:PBECR2 nuclease fold domain-containing protein [Ornithobacterium rhinotracheale]QAR30653.1 hypothetical protein EQP59_04480 [Ornithobacterium rhinotracheale]